MQPISQGKRIERAERIRAKAVGILQRYIDDSKDDLSHTKEYRRQIAEQQISEWQDKINTLSQMDHAEEILRKIRSEYHINEAFEV